MTGTAAPQQIQTCLKKLGRPRGMARASIELVAAMRAIAEAAQPITGRGIGYKLFIAGMIPSMSKNDMARVYRMLLQARERGFIPWSWIVDETRAIERIPSWDDPADFVETVSRAYRKDFWKQQPTRVVVASEKGTVRGVLRPILDDYGVGFLVLHGFSGATAIHDIAEDGDGRPLIVLYVGDFDPSGLYMSECDIPARFARYGGDFVKVRRVALLPEHLPGLPSFPASDKEKDPRFKWFTKNHGSRCWELDALDQNVLRDAVEAAVTSAILDAEAWARCVVCERAERESLQDVLANWGGAS